MANSQSLPGARIRSRVVGSRAGARPCGAAGYPGRAEDERDHDLGDEAAVRPGHPRAIRARQRLFDHHLVRLFRFGQFHAQFVGLRRVLQIEQQPVVGEPEVGVAGDLPPLPPGNQPSGKLTGPAAGQLLGRPAAQPPAGKRQHDPPGLHPRQHRQGGCRGPSQSR